MTNAPLRPRGSGALAHVKTCGTKLNRQERLITPKERTPEAHADDRTLKQSEESNFVIVLVWIDNRILSDLVTRNLARRGFDVRLETSPPPSSSSAPVTPIAEEAGLAIVDLTCPEPELWRSASRVRRILPSIPLVLLGHAWPASAQLDRLQPCTYVRKPFSIDALVAAVHQAPTNAPSVN